LVEGKVNKLKLIKRRKYHCHLYHELLCGNNSCLQPGLCAFALCSGYRSAFTKKYRHAQQKPCAGQRDHFPDRRSLGDYWPYLLCGAVHFFPWHTTANLSLEVYDIMLASSTLVWALSSAFLFLNLGRFYFQDPVAIRKQLIFPVPVIWTSIVVGTTACGLAIVGTLFYSWTALIPNSNWWYIIGGLTLVCLIIAAIGSMLASSEAAWQGVSRE
jgi:hypothetical protein